MPVAVSRYGAWSEEGLGEALNRSERPLFNMQQSHASDLRLPAPWLIPPLIMKMASGGYRHGGVGQVFGKRTVNQVSTIGSNFRNGGSVVGTDLQISFPRHRDWLLMAGTCR